MMTGTKWLQSLKEGLEKAAKRVEEVRGTKKEWIVFGTGATAELHQPCFEAESIHPIAYVDNDSSKYQTGYYGKPVIPPSEIAHYVDGVVLICTDARRTCREIGEQLKSMDIPFLLVAEYVYSRHAKEILENAAVLDEASLSVYADRILAHLENRPMQHLDRRQYFTLPTFTGCAHREVFVDIGSYVGDTIEQYLYDRQGAFTRIYGIEPNDANYAALSVRVERLRREWALGADRIQLVKAGIGKENCHGRIVLGGGTNAHLGSHVVEEEAAGDDNTLSIYKLDDLFEKEHIGFLKADIESHEMDMLQGGIHTIKRDRPKIAVCIYHSCSDMYRILSYLRKELTDYHFDVRHHSSSYCETVLYACPVEATN